MPVQVQAPWWAYIVEFLFDMECVYHTDHEIRFRRNGVRERAKDWLNQGA